MYSFCAMYSLRMSVWIVPRSRSLHVVERVDRDALPSDLAERARMVRVVAHQRRHVERSRQSRLAVLEQVAEALVRLLRGAETRELAHRPEAAAVHRRIDTARERIDPRIAEVAVVIDLHRLRGVERLVLDPGHGREELALPLRLPVVQLPPGLDAGGSDAPIVRGGHCRSIGRGRSPEPQLVPPRHRTLRLDLSLRYAVSTPLSDPATGSRTSPEPWTKELQSVGCSVDS